jgi:hypothetical protein
MPCDVLCLMKTPNLRRFLSSLNVAIFALTAPVAFAHDDGDGEHRKDAALMVSLEARAKLTPPSGLGPAGAAAVEARNVDGVVRAEVEVSTRGLIAGTYTVRVTRKSDGSLVTLGTFTVAATGSPVVTRKRGHADDHDKKGKRKIEFSTKHGTLPADFDGFDVGAVRVSNSAEEVVLGGDLSRSVDLIKRARLVADASAPAASGRVAISSTTRAGVTRSRFVLTAKGLPAGAALQLALDGADVQSVAPDARGRATVRSLPAGVDIVAIETVALHDAADVKLLSTSFLPGAE